MKVLSILVHSALNFVHFFIFLFKLQNVVHLFIIVKEQFFFS